MLARLRNPAVTDETIRNRTHGGFFAVDRRCWAKACEAGLNAAAAYLVQARGTGRDQRATAWSVHALETYTGISRSRAKAAIKTLQAAGLTCEAQGGTRPRYEITPWAELIASRLKLTVAQSEVMRTIASGDQPTGRHRQLADSLVMQGALALGEGKKFCLLQPDWIWLPNEFVTGAAGEIPPLELLRQSQDVMALRLAVDLYHAQNLREDGGVSRHITRYKYDRFEVGRHAQFTVWGFRRDCECVFWNATTQPHRRETLTKEEKKAGENAGVDFFARMQLLADTGLVEWVPHLVESDDAEAEIIHPLTVNKEDPARLENRLGNAAHQASRNLLTTGQRDWANSNELWLVPVLNHLTRVQVVGIARLRYRPQTRLTAAWWADLQSAGEQWVRRYTELAVPASMVEAS
jgi:hypothetical protein